jgi:hypothetical protein
MVPHHLARTGKVILRQAYSGGRLSSQRFNPTGQPPLLRE